jgi:hypothetical protein
MIRRRIAVLFVFSVIACPMAWAAIADEHESLAFHGVVGGVLIPHDKVARDTLAAMTHLGFRKVDDETDKRLVLEAIFPNRKGQRHFVGKLPVGTYMVYEFGFRSAGGDILWIELEGEEHRLSVLPATLTDLGSYVFFTDGAGLTSQLQMVQLSTVSGSMVALQRHPLLRVHTYGDVRGWDEQSDIEEDLLRGGASLSGPPASLPDGTHVMPTMLGDLTVRLADGKWSRVRGPGVGRLHRVLALDGPYLVLVGESGIHIGRIDEPGQWEMLPLDPRVTTVVDAVLSEDRLILLAEERERKAEKSVFPPHDYELHTDATASVLAMPWPELDAISVLERVSIPETLDLAASAAMTSNLALIPRGGNRYYLLSLVGDAEKQELAGIERVHAQGDHLFFKPTDSADWADVSRGDLEQIGIVTNVRTRQPPVVLPDGRILIHGRVVESGRISQVGYYWSRNGQDNWQAWHDSDTDCDVPATLHVSQISLYQYCESGRLFRSEIDNPEWTLEEHATQWMLERFPVSSQEIGL